MAGTVAGVLALAAARSGLRGRDRGETLDRRRARCRRVGAASRRPDESDSGQPGNEHGGTRIGRRAGVPERAFPADTISVAQAERSMNAFGSAFGRPFPGGKGKKGVWTNVGPSQALYPFTELRNAFNYVPNEYVAGGGPRRWPSATCACVPVPAWITPAGGGVWGTLNVLSSKPKWFYLAARSHQRRGRDLGRPQRPDRQHDLRRNGRGQHLRLRLCGRRRPVQVHQRRHHLDGPLGGRVGRQGHRRDRRQAGRPQDPLRGHDHRVARHVSVCCSV